MSSHGAGFDTHFLPRARGGGSEYSEKEKDGPVDQSWPKDVSLARALAQKTGTSTDSPIPSGTVYLAQMMIHDLVASVPTGNRQRPFDTAVGRPLMFDSLYGQGPGTSLNLYKKEPDRKIRTLFREADLPTISTPVNTLARPDLYRLMHGKEKILETMSQVNGYNDEIERTCLRAVRKNGLVDKTETITGDMRNDSHTIIAQMTAAWQRYHNALFDQSVGWTIVKKFPDPEDEAVRHLRFLTTQNAVRRTWLRVLETDVLPWIVGPAPTDLSGPFRRGVIPPTGVLIALRALHALPQNAYWFNGSLQPGLKSILDLGSHSDNAADLNATWAIDWTLFFDDKTPGTERFAVNRTSFTLMQAKALDAPKPRRAPDGGRLPVLALDLMRSRQMLGGPGQEQIPGCYDAILPNGLNTKAGRCAAVSNALQETNLDVGLITEFATNPPLLLILALEAEHQDGGKRARLGPLGSALLQPWLTDAIKQTRSQLEQSEFKADDAPQHARFLDIVAT